ncbi:uncharacterized protein LOC141617544 [Silene latifolia]|uniref:uncharacterized protein LOC141617544 n=1 Tax=Silene latifolia TaxID=37657 RepID=UPI003D784994
MKIASWNIRGGNDPLKQKKVLDLLKNHKLDILGVLETRIKKNKANKIITNKFHAYNVICNYSAHVNGIIWLVWRPNTVTITLLIIHTQFIHCAVSHHATCNTFHLTMVYASNNARRVSNTPPCLADILDFNSCLLKCGLDDLNSTGCDMTWTNNQDIVTQVWSKLDRALVNTQWMAQFPATAVHFLPSGISDHSPSLVNVLEDKYVGPHSSFLNCWVNHPTYHDSVMKAWQTPVQGSKIFTLFRKLKNVRTQMKVLHKHSFSQIQQRVKDRKEALHECQRQIQAHLHLPELYAQEKLLLDNYMKLKRAEGSIIQQKAKVNHISYSDSFSKYLFARIHERKHQKIIGQIKDKDGHDRVGLENVALGFIDYYQHLLGSSTTTQPIDPVTDAEIKAGVFSIGSDKSPGPDGFSSAFFKASWDLVGPDFCTAVHVYFRYGRLNKQANATLIT